jgi:hypothetical protein
VQDILLGSLQDIFESWMKGKREGTSDTETSFPLPRFFGELVPEKATTFQWEKDFLGGDKEET